MEFYVWYTIMHSCVFIFMHQTIFMWLWYLRDRDIWHVCSLLWIIYMSYHLCYAHLLCFRILLRCKWALLLKLMLISYFLVHHVGLGHISSPNSFVLSVKSWYEPSMLTTSSLFTYSRLYCHQSLKSGRLKASRPLVGFQWLMTIQDYYD